MRYYIEAYDEDDRQILGNLDGQASINAKQPRRTNAWKVLSDPDWQAKYGRRVRYWRLVDSSGRVIAFTYNVHNRSEVP